MSKRIADETIMRALKEEEQKVRDKRMAMAVKEGSVKVEPIDFDVWFSQVADKLHSMHKKEVIKSDFKARGLSTLELPETYVQALAKYGVKLG